jgi:hypothetical protein
MPAVMSPTQQRVILEGVSWDSYACLLADFGDNHAARLAYDQGTLEIIAPSYAHEELNADDVQGHAASPLHLDGFFPGIGGSRFTLFFATILQHETDSALEIFPAGLNGLPFTDSGYF